jgi:PII-like signaling protein
LAEGLSIVCKWLLESNVSRLDVFLNNKYNSEGASLVRAIIEAMDETIKGERVYR